MCFLIVILLCFILSINLLYTLHILPDVIFLIGSILMRFPSVLLRLIMYLFPWLDITRNCPVWSVSIMCLMSSTFTFTSCTLGCGDWISWGCCLLFLVFVDCTPFLFGTYVLFVFHFTLNNILWLLLLFAWATLHKILLLLHSTMLFLLKIHGSIILHILGCVIHTPVGLIPFFGLCHCCLSLGSLWSHHFVLAWFISSIKIIKYNSRKRFWSTVNSTKYCQHISSKLKKQENSCKSGV